MSTSPEIQPQPPSAHAAKASAGRGRRWLLHAYRWFVLLAILWLIREQHRQILFRRQSDGLPEVALESVRDFYPNASGFASGSTLQRGRTVVDANGTALGFIVQTSPACDHVIGYSGPTDTLIAFDARSRILGIEVLESGDTPDHLAAVVTDEAFMTRLNGLTWQQAAARTELDGVSGATLTSLAIAQGISERLGGEPHSYRFPDPIAVHEAAAFFPGAHRLIERPDKITVYTVLDPEDEPLGYVTRSSPTADDTIGYQGPTDTLMGLDQEDCIAGLAIRSSYETEQYVGWVKEDQYFMTLFDGKSLDELAELDLWEARVEGVSGATMTSMNIAETLVATARRVRDEVPPSPRPSVTMARRDLGTIAVVCLALLMTFSRLRRRRRARLGLLVILIGYLGFVNGDMISQALLVGWAQGSVPWRTALGLVFLTVAALAVAACSQQPFYCVRLCPHGAAQQLLARRLPWQLRMPARLGKWLAATPAILLPIVAATAMLQLPIKLAGLEPFDGYVFRVAGWSSILIALAGLIASSFLPMAYCRYGCPTGGLLEFLRLKGHADRWTKADLLALLVLAGVLSIHIVSVQYGWPQ